MNIIYNEVNGLLYVEPIALFLQSSVKGPGPIALRLVISKEEGQASWHDTSRNHTILFQNSNLSNSNITFEENGVKYTFTPLTVERYNSIKSLIISPGKSMSTNEEIQNFYYSDFTGV